MLTAAERCFDRFGIAKTTMEDIGRTAGVSRATVYRCFADREALLLASVIRRARSDMPRARRHLAQFGTFGEKLVEGLVRNVERGRRDPIVQLLVTSDQPALAARVLGGEGVSHQLSYELWEPVLAAAQESGEMNRALDRRMAATWLARVTLIMVTQENPPGSARTSCVRSSGRSWCRRSCSELLLPRRQVQPRKFYAYYR